MNDRRRFAVHRAHRPEKTSQRGEPKRMLLPLGRRISWRAARTAWIVAVIALMAATLATVAFPLGARAAQGTVNLIVEALVNYGGNGTRIMYANGKPAFCVEPDVPTPNPGSYARTDLAPDGGDAALVRAVLYFGAGGPEANAFDWPLFAGQSGQTDAQIKWVETHLLASYAWTGSLDDALHEVDGPWRERREWFLYNLFGMDEEGRVTNKNATLQLIESRTDEVPDSFYVYQINTGAGRQTLVSWAHGVQILITKRSSSAAPTRGNDAYSLEGAVFEIRRDADDALVATVTTGEDGIARCTVAPNERYYAVETAAPQGFKLNSTTHTIDIGEDDETLEIENEPATLTLVLHKADAATGSGAQRGSSLGGAEYQLTDATGAVHRATSDYGGCVSFEELPLGDVTVIETKAPAGYLLDPATHTYHVDSGDIHADIDLEPEAALTELPLAFDLDIIKYLDTGVEGSGLQTAGSGVAFQIISNTSDEVVGTVVTDETGRASTAGLWFGSGTRIEGIDGALPYDERGYTVREDPRTTPTGYHAAPDWTITPEQMIAGATLHYIVDNDFVSSRLQLTKVDARTGAPIPLAGFTFQLLDENHEPITQESWYPNHVELSAFTTDESGMVTLPEALLPGTYYIRETAAPEPYLLNSEDIEIVIDDAADVPLVTVVSIPDERPTGTAKVTKTCSDDGKPLEGASFDIIASEDIVAPDGSIDAVAGQIMAHLTTDDDGTACAGELPLGSGSATYHLVETDAPVGHSLDTEPHPFTLTYADATTSVVFQEVSVVDDPNIVRISKVSVDSNQPLGGAVFELRATGAGTAQRFATDSMGSIVIDHLAPDTYRLQEIEAPSGYLVDGTVHTFTVDEDGLIAGATEYHLELVNDCTKVSISKRDITDESEVPGAMLSVLDAKGGIIDTWISTTEEHRIDALAPGSYTLVETMSPNSYDVTTEIPFTVEETGDIQRVVMYDEPIAIEGEIDKRQEIADPTAELTEANGDGMNRAGVSRSDDGSYEYSVDFRNASDTWVDEFTVTDELTMAQAGIARLTGITTPCAAKDYDGLLNVWYRTNATADDYKDPSKANATTSDGHDNPWLTHETTARVLGDDGRALSYAGWRLWKADVSTTQASELSVTDLDLDDGEVVTAVRFEFGRVEAGFTSRANAWNRSDLKCPHDDLDDIPIPTQGAAVEDDARGMEEDGGARPYASSGAILHMQVTDAYRDDVPLINSAHVDLFRNGGDIGEDTSLEDHDEDTVEQMPRSTIAPLAQTDSTLTLPALATTMGVASIGSTLIALWKRRTS